MTDLVRIAITNIKNRAESTKDPNVYTLAQIPPPSVHAPVVVPSVEYRVTAQRQNFISTPGAAVMITFGSGGSGSTLAASGEIAGFVGPENNAATEAA